MAAGASAGYAGATGAPPGCHPLMDEGSIDLRDHRGRLVRLAIAVAAGLAITIVSMRWIRSDSVKPNTDPVGGSSVALLAIAIFVVTSMLALSIVTKLARRRVG